MMIVTAWQAMALHTAKRSGLKFDGLQSSLDRIVDYTAGLTAQDGGIGNASDPWEGMNPAKQQPRAQQPHSKATERKQTCIDCHKGIAHQKPKGMKDEDEEE